MTLKVAKRWLSMLSVCTALTETSSYVARCAWDVVASHESITTQRSSLRVVPASSRSRPWTTFRKQHQMEMLARLIMKVCVRNATPRLKRLRNSQVQRPCKVAHEQTQSAQVDAPRTSSQPWLQADWVPEARPAMEAPATGVGSLRGTKANCWTNISPRKCLHSTQGIEKFEPSN